MIKRPVSPNSSCHQTVFVTKRPLSPNGLCHQTVPVTERSLTPNGLCHQTVLVTKRPSSPNGPCHQTAFVTKRSLSPNGPCHQALVFARLFREGGGLLFDLMPSRGARSAKNLKLKFALCSRGCFGKEVGYYET